MTGSRFCGRGWVTIVLYCEEKEQVLGEHRRCQFQPALFAQGFGGLRDLARSLLGSLTVAFLCATVHRYLRILYVSMPDPLLTADVHLQLQNPQRVSRLYLGDGSIFLAISFPKLLKPLPPASSGSLRADIITNFAVLGSDSESQHLPESRPHSFAPFWRFSQAYHTPGSSWNSAFPQAS